MKLNVLLWVVVLLGVFLPRSADGRPALTAAHRRLLPRLLLLHLGEEVSLHLGEEVFLHLGGRGGSSSAAPPDLRAQLQLTQHPLQAQEEEEAMEKGKRSEEPPISLDLTFHLLREVLELARAEQLAQQVDSNRRMMDAFGK